LEQALVQPPGFYGENGIETRFGVRATRVDATEKVVEIDGAMPPRLEPRYP
jgi:NADPH-dependent 2,4-dienoyl-CoA reductase/sulfur reductase-like enzyme